MIRERLKTILLIFLVLTSLFLTRQAWIQSPYESLFVFDSNDIQLADFLFIDVIKPYKYLLNFNEKSHTVFYEDINNDLWNMAHSLIANTLSSNNIQMNLISHEEFINYFNNRSVIYYFPVKLNTYILARALNVSKPNDITDKIEELDSIYVYLDDGKPYVVFSQEQRHLKVYDSSLITESIKNRLTQIEKEKSYTYYYSIRDIFKVDNDLFLPYEISKKVPTAYIENQLNTNDIEHTRKKAEEFFNKQIDYIREIVEDSGSILYVYKDKVLKFYPNGLLEYFCPLEEKVTERNLYLSLNTALEFLSSHVDLPMDIYLANVEEISLEDSLGYRFSFNKRIKGFPMIIKGYETQGFIQIEVFNEHVTNYKRFVREEMDITDSGIEKDVLSAFDIINLNYDRLKEDYIKRNNILAENMNDDAIMKEILLSIDDISIAYLDSCKNAKSEELICVWLLKIDNVIYGFDVYEGNLVFVRE